MSRGGTTATQLEFLQNHLRKARHPVGRLGKKAINLATLGATTSNLARYLRVWYYVAAQCGKLRGQSSLPRPWAKYLRAT